MHDRRKQRRWTEEDLGKTAVGAKRKQGRYGNVNKIEEDGIRFDSKREYLRYADLKLLERAGEISELRVHPAYDIIIGGVPIMVSSNQHNKWDRQLQYIADFEYYENGQRVIEDVKMQSGHRTGIYKLKRALMRAMGYEITEY
jgi:hypothetical protein